MKLPDRKKRVAIFKKTGLGRPKLCSPARPAELQAQPGPFCLIKF